MTPAGKRRAAAGVLGWMAATMALAVAGMQPSVLTLAALVAALATVLWLVLDVADLAEPVDWRPSGARLDIRHSGDGRQRQMHRLLIGLDQPHAVEQLQQHLARIAADRCGGAALPAELAAHLTSHPADARLADPQHLAQVIGLIESLPGDTRS